MKHGTESTSQPVSNDFDLENRVRSIKSRIAEIELRIGSKSKSAVLDPQTVKPKTSNHLHADQKTFSHESLQNQRASELNSLKQKLMSQNKR